MKIRFVLSALLVASAMSLGIGGYLLYIHLLVPMMLVVTTVLASVVLVILAYFVASGRNVAINIATGLGVLAPLITLIPAHIGVVSEIETGGLIGSLGILQVLGFDVFPVIYVVLRVVFWVKSKGERTTIVPR